MNTKVLSQFRDEKQLRGLSRNTQQAYERCVKKFFLYADCPVRRVGVKQTKAFLLLLEREQGLSAMTRNQYAAALRFLFVATLGKQWARDSIPNAREPKKLPEVLSGSEVMRLLRGFDSPTQKTVALLGYGAGLRVSEAVSLQVGDIDSERRVIHVRYGKGGKAREVALGESLLGGLRKYWVSCRPRGEYLFPGRKPGAHMTRMAFNKALRKAVGKAGIDKRVSPHTLRHSYATHMIESGVDLRSVQLLLGHGSIQSTARYVHLTHARMQSLKSPLDALSEWQARKNDRLQGRQQRLSPPPQQQRKPSVKPKQAGPVQLTAQ
jgi:site-specific recombinase XerD